MMSEFEKKCLVTKAWNRVKNSYIYCVHDLLLDYLKRQLTELEKRVRVSIYVKSSFFRSIYYCKSVELLLANMIFSFYFILF